MSDFLWKLCPFRANNRSWLCILMQGYAVCLFASLVLGAALNYLEGANWGNKGSHGTREFARGDTAVDECWWFIFTTLHGIGFGEFLPKDTPGHMIAMVTVALSYWFMIMMMAIVMLSQLPRARVPGLFDVVGQMVSSVWPTYLIYIAIILVAGAFLGPHVSTAPSGYNDSATGIYWLWCVMHRAPFGDIWPNTPIGRTISFPAAFLSYMYPPYALALIAVRRPTPEEYDELVEYMSTKPADAMGRGYVVPSSGDARTVQLSNTQF